MVPRINHQPVTVKVRMASMFAQSFWFIKVANPSSCHDFLIGFEVDIAWLAHSIKNWNL